MELIGQEARINYEYYGGGGLSDPSKPGFKIEAYMAAGTPLLKVVLTRPDGSNAEALVVLNGAKLHQVELTEAQQPPPEEF